MRLFIHALGASAGGGLTYLRNLIPHLLAKDDVEVKLLAGKGASGMISAVRNLEIIRSDWMEQQGTMARFWWEQTEIPRLVRGTGSDVLLSTGNFAIWNSPVPQILLSRNSLYTSVEFRRDLQRRGEWGMWADTRLKGMLARQSIRRAQLAVAPSEAFAHELRDWTGREVAALHHGFDRELFLRNETPLPSATLEKLKATEGARCLLHVSHYNYYRNFETLLRGVALLKARWPARRLRLVLTCELAPGKNPGDYRTDEASALLRDLKIEDEVVQLGAIPYPQLHHLYRHCDVYVTAAYTETFAHPLVEAMGCGLPIVASDLAVHREITNGSALFFERFSEGDLADKVSQILDSPALHADLRERGQRQASTFSWEEHATRLIEMARGLMR